MNRVRGTWGSLRMKVHSPERSRPVSNTFVAPIIRIDEPGLPALWKRILDDGIAVILRRHIAPVGSHLDAGLVLTAVPKLKLIRVGPGRQSQDLMTEADTEYGITPVHGLSDIDEGLPALLRISRAVRDHHAIELFIQEVIIPGHPGDRNTPVHQIPNDAILAAAVNNHNPRVAPFIPHGLLRADQGDQILGVGIRELWPFLRQENSAQHGAFFPQ